MIWNAWSNCSKDIGNERDHIQSKGSSVLPAWLKYELREKWERAQGRWQLAGIREWINERPKGVVWIAGLSAGLLLIVLTIQWLGATGPPEVEHIEREWYYDLNTGKLFTAEKGQTPPIAAPSGPLPSGAPAGVRAYVLSYVAEPNESERFIGFLERSAPANMVAKWSSRGRPSATKTWGKGRLIRRVGEQKWVPADSAAGQKIFNEAFAANENGERPTYCRPR